MLRKLWKMLKGKGAPSEVRRSAGFDLDGALERDLDKAAEALGRRWWDATEDVLVRETADDVLDARVDRSVSPAGLRAKRPRIALCMIVKNEEKVLPRLIESVAAHIDFYVICDTGSTDRTMNVVREEMTYRGIEGILFTSDWVDFGTNRSQLLAKAQGRADWLLLMDADWTLEVSDDFGCATLLQWAEAWENEPLADCQLVAAAGGFQMTHKVLVRGDKPWKAVGAVHEVIACEEPFSEELLSGVTWTHHADSGTRDTRAEQDEAILRAAIERNPNDSRSVFYLAQTLKDMGRTAEAVGYYLRRAELGGWEQETYLSLVYTGRLAAGIPGDAFTEADRLGLFFRAWALLPARLEALYELVSWARVNGHYEAASNLLRFHPAPDEWETPGDAVFAEGWIADYGLRFEESIVAYWVGRYGESIELCEALLGSPVVPAEKKIEVAANLQAAQAALGISL